MDRIEISAERSAELTLEAYRIAAKQSRQIAQRRSLAGGRYAPVRKAYRDQAAEYDALHAELLARHIARQFDLTCKCGPDHTDCAVDCQCECHEQ